MNVRSQRPILILALLSLPSMLISCASNPPTAVPDDEVARMKPVRAVVQRKDPCAALFRAEDGKQFYVGGPDASSAIVRFVSSLHVGQAYTMPQALLDFQSRQEEEKASGLFEVPTGRSGAQR